jgi:hypothetical protein
MKRIEIELWAHGYIIRSFDGKELDHQKVWKLNKMQEIRIGTVPYDINGRILAEIKEWLG